MEMLTCSKCKTPKEATPEFFPLHKYKKNGLDSWCRSCRNEYRAAYRESVPPKEWGVPSDDLEKFKEAKQASVCVICGDQAGTVDHDHKTGKIRGPLCHRCNLGIGHFRDDPELLEFAAMYLRGECACGKCQVMWGGYAGSYEG